MKYFRLSDLDGLIFELPVKNNNKKKYSKYVYDRIGILALS